MDLEATLIRAEHLFRRFRRLVDTIDSKHTFPPPRIQSAQESSQSAASTPSTNTGGSGPGATTSPRRNTGKAPEAPSGERIITPELRRLLSRTVDSVPRKKPVAKTASSLSEGS
ncbi:hypothetical protein IMZ48_23655 [Candidatus Bathyarchaeota archaeon]|nr:hypothetical protein [Candidatus Bathyarchaeota archaeon]